MNRIFSRLVIALSQLSGRINGVCLRLSAVFFILMLGSTFLQVISRYLFRSPPSWTEEGARYCMVWMGFLGATVAFYRNENPAVVQTGPVWMGPISRSAVKLLCAAMFLGPIAWFGPGFIMRNAVRSSEAMGLNSALVVSIVPLFAAIVLIHATTDLLAAISRSAGAASRHPAFPGCPDNGGAGE